MAADLSFKLLRKREPYQPSIYNALSRYQSHWSKGEKVENPNMIDAKDASVLPTTSQQGSQTESNSGVSKYSTDEDDPNSNKWKPELAWLTKTLEPALQLCRWPLPAGNADGNKIPPSSRSLAEILASIQRSKLEVQDWSLSDLTIGFYLVYLQQTSKYPFEDVKGVKISSDEVVQDLIYHVELAKGAYRGSAAALARNSMLRESNIVKYVKNSSMLRPGYYLGVDIRNKLVIFGIRGTHTVSDLITDIVSSSHEEVNFEAIQLILGFRLRLVGHSLGGAIASMLAIMIRKKTSEELGFSPEIVTAVGYGTPPCVSRELAECCSDYVTTVCMQLDKIDTNPNKPTTISSSKVSVELRFLEIVIILDGKSKKLEDDWIEKDDIIPRLSVATLMRLRNEILQTDWKSIFEKVDWRSVSDLVTNAKQVLSSVQDVAKKLVDYTKFGSQAKFIDVPGRKDSIVVQDCIHSTSKPEAAKANDIQKGRPDLAFPQEELFIPGSVYFLKRKEEKHNGSNINTFTLWKRHTGEHYQRILLSNNLIADHKCDSHYYALRDVLKGIPMPQK
ncbi:hypothetical protein L1987_60357 [Smallanthus sonchifolius]|uniref:Uncharacterized protein n=1 Tax=Smallanthus sonchifolius TaxID=185202 RepID=A0ACB9D7Z5_9ASTR|nr:hypothetical protein L1987_60357 [Smallanthus sonchifolius]